MKTALKIGAVLLLSVTAFAAQRALRDHRPDSSPALAESAFAAFGAFRSIAAEIVWFRAERLQEEGRYVELAQLAHALTAAEPHTPEVWGYAAWNLAYNVSVMMPSPEDRWRWVDAALKLLRDDGLRLNPVSVDLHRELAWLFELKLATNLDNAAGTYRAKWRARVEDVARRDAWDELGMDRALMADVERRFGLADRGHPCYSAVYWAWRGICRGRGDTRVLKEIIRQSLLIHAHGPKTRAASNG